MKYDRRPKFLWLTLFLWLSGCAHYTLQVPEPNPKGQTWKKTYVAYFWGAIETERIAQQCDAPHALDMVRAKDNLLYDVVSVLTLGIVKPMTIEYKCSAGESQVGDPIGGGA